MVSVLKISNVSMSVTWKDLNSITAQAGAVRLIPPNQTTTSTSRSYHCFAEFRNGVDADYGLHKLHQLCLRGKRLVVTYADDQILEANESVSGDVSKEDIQAQMDFSSIAPKFGIIKLEIKNIELPPSVVEKCVEKVSETFDAPVDVIGSSNGFGTLEAQKRVEQSEGEKPSEEEISEFITKKELESNRVKEPDFSILPVFKNWEPGEPNARLYVKNLAKQVEEKDLKFIYGRYVIWTSEEECNMFDIRLMQEGRMKGQAFVTLPNSKRAKEALKETNGYILHGKPMVVQFARAAKPKDPS